MRKISLLCLMIVLGTTSYAQTSFLRSDSTRHPEYDAHHWKVHSTLRTIGWVSLGTGVPTILIGLVVAFSGIESSAPEKAEKAGTWFAATGAALAVGSLPCVLISSSYKKKTIPLYMGNQQVSTPVRYGFFAQGVPHARFKSDIMTDIVNDRGMLRMR